jgi:VIT1/CCC1 family predicted Fe2+/Mn2+ transporter
MRSWMTSLKTKDFSFGSTAAIVTSVALIIGFEAAAVTKATIVSGLLVIALADNLSDSLSIHVYQEAERIERRSAFRATVRNFVARLLISLTFIAVVVVLPAQLATFAAAGWALVLLVIVTVVLAKERGADVSSEVWKHLIAAAGVLALSWLIGAVIPRVLK